MVSLRGLSSEAVAVDTSNLEGCLNSTASEEFAKIVPVSSSVILDTARFSVALSVADVPAAIVNVPCQYTSGKVFLVALSVWQVAQCCLLDLFAALLLLVAWLLDLNSLVLSLLLLFGALRKMLYSVGYLVEA